MRHRSLLALAAIAVVAAGGIGPVSAAPARPQVVDVAGDANFTGSVTADKQLAVGNQDWGDVTSVLWKPVTKVTTVRGRRVTTVTGLTATLTFVAAPVAPSGTAMIIRASGLAPCGQNAQLVLQHYTSGNVAPVPQTSLRDTCTQGTRYTPLPAPTFSGNTVTFTVPLSAVPKDVKLTPGATVRKLWFEVKLWVPLAGQCVLSTCGVERVAVDNSQAQGDFKIG